MIQRHVSRIPQLPSDRAEPQHLVAALCVSSHGGGLEVLDGLADAQDLACQAELLLHRIVGCDGGLRVVGAVEVP